MEAELGQCRGHRKRQAGGLGCPSPPALPHLPFLICHLESSMGPEETHRLFYCRVGLIKSSLQLLKHFSLINTSGFKIMSLKKVTCVCSRHPLPCALRKVVTRSFRETSCTAVLSSHLCFPLRSLVARAVLLWGERGVEEVRGALKGWCKGSPVSGETG